MIKNSLVSLITFQPVRGIETKMFKNCCVKRKIWQHDIFTLLRSLKGLGKWRRCSYQTVMDRYNNSGPIFSFHFLWLRSIMVWYFILIVLLWQEEFWQQWWPSKSHNLAESEREVFPCQLSKLFTLIIFLFQTQG